MPEPSSVLLYGFLGLLVLTIPAALRQAFAPAKPSDEGTRATSGMQRERTPSGGENAAERSSMIAAARARYLERRKQKQQAPPP